MSPYLTYVSFHPSDDFFSAALPFHHLYDDIAIYEGYVPPDGGPITTTAPSPPTSLRSTP